MIKSLRKTLSKPFPYTDSFKDDIIIAVFFGLFIFIFLSIFQPYGLSEITHYKFVFIAGYGLVTLFSLLITLYILWKTLAPEWIENWNVGLMILLISLEILLISFLNWVYTATIGSTIIGPYKLSEFIFFTLEVAIIPSAFFIILFEQILEQKNRKEAKSATKTIKSALKAHTTSNVQIGSVNQVLDINLDHLICIQAQGNYVEVFYTKENEVSKTLLRSPLSKVNEQTRKHNPLKQCHRSYIVNFDKIEKVSGNARNFNLHLKGLDFLVPVSRNFPPTTIMRIKEYNNQNLVT